MIVRARSLLNGQWSPLSEAIFFAGPPELRVSEVMYHPAAPTPTEIAAGYYTADDFEFLEVMNVSDTATIALDGLHFTSGIEFAFAAARVPPWHQASKS